ncbi:MAG: hypothetical protein VX258_06335, partial [Pseudomonadota bacterium]|nr:hypothetical protein [Pseudomonadota bacterium]
EKNRFSLCVLCGLCGKCRFSGLGYRAASDAPTERGRLESGFSRNSEMYLYFPWSTAAFVQQAELPTQAAKPAIPQGLQKSLNPAVGTLRSE